MQGNRSAPAAPARTSGTGSVPGPAPIPEARAEPRSFSKIVLATDGSAPAERAFSVALQLAKACGAALEILTVVPSYPEYAFGSVAGAPPAIPDEEAKRYLREVAARLKERAEAEGVARVTIDVLEGHPGTLILSESKVRRPDLVVLGARGVSTSHRILLGSVSNAVALGATFPVLVVRGGAPATGRTVGGAFDRVIVATDGSPSARRALDLAIEVCRSLGAPLRIVTVVPVPSALGAAGARKAESTALSAAGALVEGASRVASERGVTDVASEVLRGPPADSILDYLGDSSTHLIAVGSRGRTRTQRLLLGSVSTALLHHAPASVLLARGVSPNGRMEKRASK
jgi:nucleotide-binding universal stress UspA family protein